MYQVKRFNIFESTRLAANSYMGSESELGFTRPNEDWQIRMGLFKFTEPFGRIVLPLSNEDWNSDTDNFTIVPDKGNIHHETVVKIFGNKLQFDSNKHYKFARLYLSKEDLLGEIFDAYVYPKNGKGATDVLLQITDDDTFGIPSYKSKDSRWLGFGTYYGAADLFKTITKLPDDWERRLFEEAQKIAREIDTYVSKIEDGEMALQNYTLVNKYVDYSGGDSSNIDRSPSTRINMLDLIFLLSATGIIKDISFLKEVNGGQLTTQHFRKIQDALFYS